MPEYRLYCLDGAGKITKAHDISANSDEDALMIARSKKMPMRCELWQRSRLVAKLPANRDLPAT
jgi:hypothetical protein